MATLVARLAGPLQAWGADTRFRVVATHATPTWSGLLGLCRAALGHGRHDDPAEVEWLRRMPMAIRVDQPGQTRLDYHTINPLPDKYLRFDKTSDLGIVPLGQPISSRGHVTRWTIRNKPPILTTRRAYLHDAAFLWLVEGDTSPITRLAYALTHPRWALMLGRKSCPPSSPLVLGVHADSLEETAHLVPVLRHQPGMSPQQREEIPLIWLNRAPDTLTHTAQIVLLDDPVGAHPQDGYTQHPHTASTTTAPALTGPWHTLLDWASTHLSHPSQGAVL